MKVVLATRRALLRVTRLTDSVCVCVRAGDEPGADGAGEDHAAEMSAVLGESPRSTGESLPTAGNSTTQW